MYDVIVALTRVLDTAAAECREKAKGAAPQSVDATVYGMLADACAKAAEDLTGAAVRASRV